MERLSAANLSAAPALKLAIVAASGGVGRQLLAQARSAGHAVTAVVRSASALSGAEVVCREVDLAATGGEALAEALRGADAVLSALGQRTRADQGIAARGTQALVQAMKQVGARRLVVVSAAPVSTTPSPGRPYPPRRDPGEGWFQRRLLTPAIRAALRSVYADLARMEDVLRASALEWTIVRPPRLTSGPLTGRYRLGEDRNVPGGLSISRADLAHFMLRAVREPWTVGKAIGIGY